MPGLLDFKTAAQDDGKAVNPTHRSPLPPRKYFWNLFLAEPRASAPIRRNLCEGKIPITHQELNSDLLV